MPVVVHKVKSLKSRKKILRNTVKNLLEHLVPVRFVRRVMETNFTHFGLEISNACNANCSFCAYRFMNRRVAILPQNLAEKTLDQYDEMGGGTLSLTPVVGDPLVDKNLLEKIKHARSKTNIKDIFLYTNALYFDRYDIREFLQSGVTRISISTFFGSKELYRKYYGVNGYERSFRNIKALAIENENQGFPVQIQLHLRVEKPEETWKATDEYKEIEALLGKENISWLEVYENWSGMITQEDLPSGCQLSEQKTISDKIKQPCFEVYRRMHVLANGDVGVCSCRDIDAEINVGNVSEKSLPEIWSGKKLKALRSDWSNGKLPEVCKSCDRYVPVDDYISRNKWSILSTHAHRFLRRKDKQ